MLRAVVTQVVVPATLIFSALTFSPVSRAQSAAPQSGAARDQQATSPDQELDGWGHPFTSLPKDRKLAPAPRHDISGIWDPPHMSGLGVFGAISMPDDGKPEHQPPYTPLGFEKLKTTKPTSGIRAVVPSETNDPFVLCDPQGMPREDLYELRTVQIFQTPERVAMLYQFGRIWREAFPGG